MYEDPRSVLKRYQIFPKKEWGQNFLVNPSKAERIVELLEIQAGDRVLELGAGTGALTQIVRHKHPDADLFALERDRDMIAILEQEYNDSHVRVLAADAATYPITELPDGGPLRILGNLPYQISTPILFHVLEQRHLWTRAILMLQREVAQRLAAQLNQGKDYSILSVRFQMFCDVRIVLHVPARCFHPKPRVESAAICIEPLPQPRFPIEDPDLFARVVKAAFANRRKTLLNTLHHAFPHKPRIELQKHLHTQEIDPQRRGESLSLKDFAQLTQSLQSFLQSKDA
ncbi:MAG: 16S rRNA (adenine(1518)-N(6)/adenine(1519)-N(6))-dimethyltransferase RsmA [Myxococcota bacterium]